MADPWAIEDLISLWFRRGQKLGLKLVQIPEYFCEANMQVHPYRAQPYIAASSPQIDDEMSEIDPFSRYHNMQFRSLYVEKCVLIDFPNEWIPDDERKTDWKNYILLNSSENALVTSTAQGGVAAMLSEIQLNARSKSAIDISTHGMSAPSAPRGIPGRRSAAAAVLDRQYLHRLTN